MKMNEKIEDNLLKFDRLIMKNEYTLKGND